MKTLNVDVAVIGAGTAGLAAYRAAVAGGRRAVLIEGGPYGTTCARVGCMPSKLLIAAAEAAHGPQKWGEFGLRLDGSVTIDGQAVMARVKRERDRFVGFVLDGVDAIPEADHIRGYARFVDDSTLTVGRSHAHHIRARGDRHRLVAGDPGGAARGGRPPDRQRRRLRVGRSAALGGGLRPRRHRPRARPGAASAGRRRAALRPQRSRRPVQRSGDPRVRDAGRFSRSSRSIPHADVSAIERVGDRVVMRYRGSDGKQRTASVDYVIAATGRTPNVRGLGLEQTTLALDPRGVPLFDRTTMQCGRHPIFIAGDASDDLPLLHEAADEGRHRGRERRALSRRAAGRAAHAARDRVLRSAARGRRRAARGSRAGELRRRLRIVRGPGPQPRDAAEQGAPSRVRRHRDGAAHSAPR